MARPTFLKRCVVNGGFQFTPAKTNRVVAFIANSFPAEIIHDILHTETHAFNHVVFMVRRYVMQVRYSATISLSYQTLCDATWVTYGRQAGLNKATFLLTTLTWGKHPALIDFEVKGPVASSKFLPG